MTSLKPGDVVTAIIDNSRLSSHGRHRSYSITGTVYEVEEHPGSLWVGGHIIAHTGEFISWITVVLLVSAGEVAPSAVSA